MEFGFGPKRKSLKILKLARPCPYCLCKDHMVIECDLRNNCRIFRWIGCEKCHFGGYSRRSVLMAVITWNRLAKKELKWRREKGHVR